MMREVVAESVPQKGSMLRKAAILVLALGNELAKEVFPRLSEGEIKVLGITATSLGKVAPEEVISVLVEFRDAFHGRTIPDNAAGPLFQFMVERALGEQRARDLLNARSSSDPFHICASADPEVLAQLLETEHPQTIAIVLASLAPSNAGLVLSHLGADASSEVVYRMGHLGAIAEDVRYDIGSTLADQLEAMGSTGSAPRLDGKKVAVAVTKALPGELSDAVLERLESRNAGFAKELRSQMFVFDDLSKLDARSMQRLLREVDSRLLMVALKSAPEEISSAIFSAMSGRAAEMLREDMEASSPIRISDVQAAQNDIIEIAFRLESEGLLALPRGGAGEMV